MFESLAKFVFRRSSDDLRLSVQTRGILMVRIGTAMIERLGWQPGQQCDLFVGLAEDAGMAQVRLADNGWRLIKDRTHRKSSTVGPMRIRMCTMRKGQSLVPGLPDRLGPTLVPAMLVGDAIEFRFPWSQPRTTDIEIRADASLPVGTVDHPDGRVDSVVNVGEARPDIELRQDGPANLPGAETPVNGQETEAQPEVSTGAELSTDPADYTFKKFEESQERAGPPTPRVDHRSDPANWPDEMRDRFIDAAARGRSVKELADICERPIGSIHNIKIKLEKAINKRRHQIQIDRERLARAPAPEPASVDPIIPEAVFLYLTRKHVFSRLNGLGHVCGQNREKTKLVLDGESMSAETFILVANRLLDLSGAEALRLP